MVPCLLASQLVLVSSFASPASNRLLLGIALLGISNNVLGGSCGHRNLLNTGSLINMFVPRKRRGGNHGIRHRDGVESRWLEDRQACGRARLLSCLVLRHADAF